MAAVLSDYIHTYTQLSISLVFCIAIQKCGQDLDGDLFKGQIMLKLKADER